MRLPPLKSIKDILKLYDLRAIKDLSQNFILDTNITDKIVKVSGILKNKIVLEIGCGPGSLTRPLISSDCKYVIGVEKDKRFFPALEMVIIYNYYIARSSLLRKISFGSRRYFEN
jgi:dimethyladenosine transferase 1, mitochondrial